MTFQTRRDGIPTSAPHHRDLPVREGSTRHGPWKFGHVRACGGECAAGVIADCYEGVVIHAATRWRR